VGVAEAVAEVALVVAAEVALVEAVGEEAEVALVVAAVAELREVGEPQEEGAVVVVLVGCAVERR